MALVETGRVYAWGFNQFGQLGNGNNENRNIPQLINENSLSNVKQISCGQKNCFALKHDGHLYAFGKIYPNKSLKKQIENRPIKLECGVLFEEIYSNIAYPLTIAISKDKVKKFCYEFGKISPNKKRFCNEIECESFEQYFSDEEFLITAQILADKFQQSTQTSNTIQIQNENEGENDSQQINTKTQKNFRNVNNDHKNTLTENVKPVGNVLNIDENKHNFMAENKTKFNIIEDSNNVYLPSAESLKGESGSDLTKVTDDTTECISNSDNEHIKSGEYIEFMINEPISPMNYTVIKDLQNVDTKEVMSKEDIDQNKKQSQNQSQVKITEILIFL
jgi:hypothetical protein